ncbi:MAG: hypothetical protein WC247_14535 [Porticoccaceae bacterium]
MPAKNLSLSRFGRAPAWLLALIAAQLVVGVGLGLPGHLSTDSIIQLYEGRTLHFISFNPPLMSLVLGALERLGSAPAGFVLISALLLAGGSWLALAGTARSGMEAAQKWRRILAAGLILNPVLLVYTGIVWKDVLLAHAVLLAFMLPDTLRSAHGPGRAAGTMLLLLLLAVIIGVRQQGILFAIPLAVCAAWRCCNGLWPRLVAILVLVAIPLATNKLATDFAYQHGLNELPPGGEVGLKILMHYDLVGMLSRGAQGAGMEAGILAEMQAEIPKYSSYRVDTLDGVAVLYWSQPLARTITMWLGEIKASPRSYAEHRLAVFSRVLGIGGVRDCLPYYRGVGGPVKHDLVSVELTALLGLTSGAGSWSRAIKGFAKVATHTPLFWHWCYLLAAAGLLLVFVRRRDWLPATLLGCTMAYMASYAVIGIACDFRYGYVLTVATSVMAARALLGSGRAATGQRDAHD